MTEKFNYIEYSDKNVFENTSTGRIQLKEYSENLLLYANLDGSAIAQLAINDTTPILTGTYNFDNNGIFSQHLHLKNGSLSYNEVNFEDLKEQGTINFAIRTDFTNAKGKQSFIKTTDPLITSLPENTIDYSKFGGASLNLIGNETKRIEYNVNNLTSLAQTGTIDFFIKMNYNNIPTSDIGIFDLYNEINNNNRIIITHETDGKLYFKIYDQSGTEIVNINFDWNADDAWHNFSFNFDLNNGNSKVFIDGNQYGSTNTNTGTRINLITGFIGLGSTSPNISNFYIDDFAIFSTVQYTTDYTNRNISLSGTETNLLIYNDFDTSLNLNLGTTIEPIGIIPTTSDYSFQLIIDEDINNISISLTSTDTITDIFNKISTAVSSLPVIVYNDPITIESDYYGVSILIKEPISGRSLLTLLDGVNSAELENGPTDNTIIMSLADDTDNNKILLTHQNNSHLLLQMYDANGILKVNEDLGEWTNSKIYWYQFSLNWNETIGQFFIDGKMKSVFSTGFTRNNSGTLTFQSHSTDFYRFDEIQVFNIYQNNKDYSLSLYPLSKYAMNNPYIDIYFGNGFKEEEISDINITSSNNIYYVLKLGNTWYYYFSGSWRVSDGSFNQSVTTSIMETKFADFFFDEELDLIIRAYFNSNGFDNEWIDEISIETSISEETPAQIMGTIDLCSGVDLSTNKHIIITTDQGNKEVDLTTKVSDISAQHIGNIDLSDGYNWQPNATAGYQEFGLNVNSTDIISLDNLTTYTFKINGTEFTFTTGIDDTFNSLITLLNNAVDINTGTIIVSNLYTVNFEINDIRITNNITGDGNDIVLANGVTGNDLFFNLNEWNGFDIAIEGRDAGSSESFQINSTIINLNEFTSSIEEIKNLIEIQLPTGIEVFINEEKYIGLKTTSIGNSAFFVLTEIDGLNTLGMIAGTYYGSSADLTNVSLEQIIDAINEANVPGLKSASFYNCYLILTSSSVGNDAYISINNGTITDALNIIWGNVSTDKGEEIDNGPYFDYSEIIDWIREQLGAPIVPVELTDDQVRNSIGRAVYWYNYYRNNKESEIIVNLEGNPETGYIIPDEVGGEDNITEIIVKPRFPFAYYTGGDVDSIMSNVYMQWMFQRGRYSGFPDFIGDYYITLQTEKDYGIIMGTELKWEFLNDKLFIYPKPTDMRIGIRFKSAITMQEMNTHPLIRTYALGDAKQILGNIRATFGGSIPGGSELITLRGESLIAEGKEEVTQALENMKKMDEPISFVWG